MSKQRVLHPLWSLDQGRAVGLDLYLRAEASVNMDPFSLVRIQVGLRKLLVRLSRDLFARFVINRQLSRHACS